MNRTERGIAAYIGEDRLKFLQRITIGIAGAGGLGSNCAMNLARCGFKNFVIVDFDRIEETNLNRQNFFINQLGMLKVEALAENLKMINPDIEMILHNIAISNENIRDIFAECDTVVEAFDKAEFKKLLVETFINTNKFIVTASGIGGYGNSDAIITRRIRTNFYMIGDMETECSEKNPPLSPRVNIAAAKQADAVLSYWLGQFSKGDQI